MQLLREHARDALDLRDCRRGKRHWWRDCRGVPRVAARSLDMFEDRPDDAFFSVRDAVDIKLDCVRQELVDEDWTSIGNPDLSRSSW